MENERLQESIYVYTTQSICKKITTVIVSVNYVTSSDSSFWNEGGHHSGEFNVNCLSCVDIDGLLYYLIEVTTQKCL